MTAASHHAQFHRMCSENVHYVFSLRWRPLGICVFCLLVWLPSCYSEGCIHPTWVARECHCVVPFCTAASARPTCEKPMWSWTLGVGLRSFECKRGNEHGWIDAHWRSTEQIASQWTSHNKCSNEAERSRTCRSRLPGALAQGKLTEKEASALLNIFLRILTVC